MNYEEKIMKLFNNGFLKTKDVVKNKIPKVYLTRLVRKGLITRAYRGIYINNEELIDDYAIIQNMSKYAIFSNMTALYFLGYSNRMPIKYDVTIPNGYKGSLQNNEKVNLYYSNKEFTKLGIISIKDNYGNNIKIYDLEKSICDIIKNKNRIDKELFNQTIRNYYYSKDKDTLKLFNYAEKMNIYEKVQKTFEILM